MATQSGISRSRKIRITLYLLQTVGLIAAIVAIPLAYWQGQMQSSHSEFEKNQRVVELSLTLATFWETQLDQETRYRLGRFIFKLKALNPEQQQELVTALLAEKNLLDSDAVREDKVLYSFIEPDLDSENPDGSKMTPVMAVARYRAALVRVLNTMEVIAIVTQHSRELPEALEVIDSAYAGSIQTRYKQLTPFVEEYRRQTNPGRRRPAWEPLTRMVDEENKKVSALR